MTGDSLTIDLYDQSRIDPESVKATITLVNGVIAVEFQGWEDTVNGGTPIIIEAQRIDGRLRPVALIWNGQEDANQILIGGPARTRRELADFPRINHGEG